ncbi:MAG: aspartyl/asparaginyl beta-hydroxylase domain-containing protein [Flavobacteriales bacterium]|nr:aspartyl/asparaginyl beta-hydroxylase domain-containing protein [Flavobacteriales bacterium]
MKSNTNNIWFSFTASAPYEGTEPPYFEISQYNWYDLIKKNTAIFKKEITTQKEDFFIPYTNSTFANEPQKWKFIPLRVWAKKYKSNIAKFPLTEKVLEKIPYLVSAAYSQLDNSSKIKHHTGDSNVMYRVHIPLVIPTGLPDCGFEVLGIQKEWVEGEPFGFCDAHQHYAWNNTNEKRIVLILDIIRPEFESKSKWICAQVQASLMLQFTFQKTKIIHKIPQFLRSFIMNFGGIIIYPVVLLFGDLKTR